MVNSSGRRGPRQWQRQRRVKNSRMGVGMTGPGLLRILFSTQLFLAGGGVEALGYLAPSASLHRAIHLYSLATAGDTHAPFEEWVSNSTSLAGLQGGMVFAGAMEKCGAPIGGGGDGAELFWPPFMDVWARHVSNSNSNYTMGGNSTEEEKEEHRKLLVTFGMGLVAGGSGYATGYSDRVVGGLLDGFLLDGGFIGDREAARGVLEKEADEVFRERWLWGSGGGVGSRWEVPVGDLLEVYKEIGREEIVGCLVGAMEGLAEVLDEERGSGEVSVWVREEVDGWMLGGVQQVAAGVVECWRGWAGWVLGEKKDEERDVWGLCDVFRAVKPGSGDGVQKRDLGRGQVLGGHERRQRYLGSSSRDVNASKKQKIRVTEGNFGVVVLEIVEDEEGQIIQKERSVTPRKLQPPNIPEFDSPLYISSYTPFSHFGHSLSIGAFGPIPGDESLHIAITAPLESEIFEKPHEGSVYVIPFTQLGGEPSSSSSSSSRSLSPRSLLTSSQNSLKYKLYKLPRTSPKSKRQIQDPNLTFSTDTRFGYASTSWRPNTLTPSGRSYLAISSPGPLKSVPTPNSPPDQLYPAGKIDIFDGAEKIQTMYTYGARLGSRGVKWWGDTLTSGKLLREVGDDGDVLVVGSSFSDGVDGELGQGFVQIVRFYTGVTTSGSGSRRIQKKEKLHSAGEGIYIRRQLEEVEDEDTVDSWTIYPPPTTSESKTQYTRFGTSLAITPASNILLIGAPGRGEVYLYGYNATENGFVLKETLSSALNSASSGGGFGKAIAVGRILDKGNYNDSTVSWTREWIAVSSREGVDVYVLTTTTATVEKMITTKLTLSARITFPQNTPLGKLSLTSLKFPGRIYIGTPLYDHESGAVWVADLDLDISHNDKNNTVQMINAELILTGQQQLGQLGGTLVAADVNGDGEEDLLVGMAFAGEASGGMGALGVFLGNSKRGREEA
ncbi:hypothetical protein DFH27DRAFT_603288 [Peziza echinospora]|nr:hypothetical protein DFH27DRAFT_603288 [Peziza echinospora]